MVEELDGVEVGGYADFSAFRDAVVSNLEGGEPGSQFPTLILHSDCDGQWTPSEAAALERELETIGARFRGLPPVHLNSDWQKQAPKTFGIQINNLNDCFFDVDGEPLVERLIGLTRLSQAKNLSVMVPVSSAERAFLSKVATAQGITAKASLRSSAVRNHASSPHPTLSRKGERGWPAGGRYTWFSVGHRGGRTLVTVLVGRFIPSPRWNPGCGGWL